VARPAADPRYSAGTRVSEELAVRRLAQLMPMMPSPLGVLPFVAIKLVGYAALGEQLRRRAVAPASGRDGRRCELPGAGTIGLARVFAGMVGGTIYAGVIAVLDVEPSTPVLFAALAPMRALEWAAVLLLLFRASQRPRHFVLVASLVGMVVSYLLDVPAAGVWWLIPGLPVC
jgi:hypothetical protein